MDQMKHRAAQLAATAHLLFGQNCLHVITLHTHDCCYVARMRYIYHAPGTCSQSMLYFLEIKPKDMHIIQVFQEKNRILIQVWNFYPYCIPHERLKILTHKAILIFKTTTPGNPVYVPARHSIYLFVLLCGSCSLSRICMSKELKRAMAETCGFQK